MRTWHPSLVGVALAIAACGPEGGGGGAAQAPVPTATASAPPSASTPPPVPPASGTAATTPALPKGPMKPIAPSQMATKLREIGLDPAALPPLNKLDPKTLRDVMNTFTKSLGVQCKFCHEKDFKAPTPKKAIVAHMWNDFVRGLSIEGGTLYCDSCHAGRQEFLDRSDLKALGDWMQENFADKLKRNDKKDHGCETCHGDPFEGKIIAKKWNIPH